MEKLPKFELRSYQFVAATSVLFFFWRCYLLSQRYLRIITSFYQFNSFNVAFISGWFNIPKDIGDVEWEHNLNLLKYIYPWIIVHILVSKIIKHFNSNQLLKFWYISISLLFSIYKFNWIVISVFLLWPSIFILVLKYGSEHNRIHNIWICAFINLLTLISFNIPFFDEHTNYFVQLAQFWSLLKCISYSIDLKNGAANFWDMIAYVFYLPTFYIGPIITYSDFRSCYMKITQNEFSFGNFLCHLLRFCFWAVIYEVVLHVFYVYSFDFYFLERQNNWSLFSIGYVVAHCFFLKYFVLYGLSLTICKYENIIVPSFPKCVSTFRMFSRTWKLFDNGLYKFLTIYIYVPILKYLKNVPVVRNRLFACLICFLCIFLWHGVYDFVFVWSAMNFIGLCFEHILCQFSQTSFYQFKFERRLSPAMRRRIKCALSVFLLTFSYFSSFVFLMRLECGFLFLKRSLSGQFIDYLSFFMFLYCMCQIIYEIESNHEYDMKQFHSLSFHTI